MVRLVPALKELDNVIVTSPRMLHILQLATSSACPPESGQCFGGWCALWKLGSEIVIVQQSHLDPGRSGNGWEQRIASPQPVQP